MAVKNCPICGRIFNDLDISEVCTNCYAENEEEFKRVKEYLYDFPNQNIVQISEATGVSIEKIKRFLRNDRLVAVDNHSTSLLDCKRCGKPIGNGSYCDECRKQIEAENRKQLNTSVSGRYRDVKMHTRHAGRR